MAANSYAESVFGAFEAAASAHPRRDWLHVPHDSCKEYSGQALTLTYGEAYPRVKALAAQLADAGSRRGHRAAVALDNRPDFFLYFLALNSLGVSIVPLNCAMSAAELGFIAAHADISLAVTHAGHAALLRSALPATAPLHVDGTGAVPRIAAPPVAAADEAALLYTSGTTGTPKGCILSQEYFVRIGRLYLDLGGYCRFSGDGDRLATPLPVTHMNALAVSFMATLMTAGCLIQLDRFHPSSWWRSLRSSRASAFHYLGVMPAMLLNTAPSADDPAPGTLRFGFGAGVDPRHHAAFEQRFGVPLIEAWAMTETGAGAWITANREPRHIGSRCFGRAPAQLDWRVVDDSGADARSGIAGELLVRQKGADPRRGFFSGYYKDDAETARAWQDGWFHSGDLVRTDADGTFYFVDRTKNIVRRSGENIAALEVESILQTADGVRACAVCAVHDELRGEEVFAFVVPAAGSRATHAAAAGLQAHCRSRLAYFKVPGYVAFCAELPQTASQKLARGLVKSLAAAALQAGQAHDLRLLKKRDVAAAPGGKNLRLD